MSESEFDIIKTYFSDIGKAKDWLVTGIGDDAAILNTDPEQQLLIATDTLNAGVHFPEETSAFDIGYKALAVNVSDIAAMGGQPLWFTLSMSLPEVNHDWLNDFSKGLAHIANKYDLNLIGGDTTRGPLSITIQIGGVIKKSKALCRDGARQGDDIYVTGTPGDAAAGLKLLQQQRSEYSEIEKRLINRLLRPCPRVDIGNAINNIATACIDISDGLAADLGHILEASGDIGAEIDCQAIPLSVQLKQSGLPGESMYELALHGGDDYELCFTAPPARQAEIQAIAEQTACLITRIGEVVKTEGVYLIDNGQRKLLSKTGFDHFISP
jgi:thiamine-monophosphate kinase